MNRGSEPVWATCIACRGTGDEWHTVRWGLPPEPFPCPNCAGKGVLPVRPPKGRSRSRIKFPTPTGPELPF